MVVVGGTYYDGVHLPLHFIEHLAVVHKRGGVGIGEFFCVSEAVVATVNIAVCNELLF